MKIKEIILGYDPELLAYKKKVGKIYGPKKIKKSLLTTQEAWSEKYKRSINCNNPKGFSQKAHCAGRKKK